MHVCEGAVRAIAIWHNVTEHFERIRRKRQPDGRCTERWPEGCVDIRAHEVAELFMRFSQRFTLGCIHCTTSGRGCDGVIHSSRLRAIADCARIRSHRGPMGALGDITAVHYSARVRSIKLIHSELVRLAVL
jgi:hypothetical protein